jgi:hypothetical protein
MFTKGQEVTVINLYSRGSVDSTASSKVSFTVEQLIVHSCGKKQMILRNAAGEIFKRRLYTPTERQYTSFHTVYPRISDEAALEIANARTVEYCARQVERHNDILARANKESEAYIRSITKDRDYYATNPVAPARIYEARA